MLVERLSPTMNGGQKGLNYIRGNAVLVKLGDTVSFQSGDVQANGKVITAHSHGLFVEADRSVPIVLGLGSRFEHYTTGTKLWLKCEGEVIRDRDDVITGFEIK